MTSISDKFLKDTMTLQENFARSLFEAVSGRYGIPVDELWEILNGIRDILPKSSESTDDSETIEVTPEDILKMKVAELKGLCKSRGLKVSGKKQDILARLLGREVASSEIKSPRKKSPRKKKKPVAKIPPVQATLKPGEIKIVKNANGDFMHSETSLIFDPDTKEVIARYSEEGGNQGLTKDDIELCNQYRFAYAIPDNLNNRGNGNDGDDAQKLAKLLADEEEEVNIARLARAARKKAAEEEEVVEEEEEEVVEEEEESLRRKRRKSLRRKSLRRKRRKSLRRKRRKSLRRKRRKSLRRKRRESMNPPARKRKSLKKRKSSTRK